MSLNTLAAAASFVESEDKKKTSPRANSSKSFQPSSTSDSEKVKRRPGGAGTREIHNRLEKNSVRQESILPPRRAQLKVCFETLKNEIPTLEDKRASNLYILKSALRYIQNLEKKSNETTKEKEDLKKRNLNLRERLKALRNEIKALLEASTKNGLKTEQTLALEASLSEDDAGSKVAPISVATQTMPMAKKLKESDKTLDGDIKVDDVTAS